MLLKDFLGSLKRRWYVAAAGLLATVAAVVGVYAVVPVTYEASASVVLIPPDESVAAGDNPYLYLGGLGQALSVMVITMNSAESHDLIIGDRSDAEYTVGQDATTEGPIVKIVATADDEAESLELAHSVLMQVPATLGRLQDTLNVPAKSRIGSLTLAESRQADVNNRRQMQLTAVALGGGIVGTLALVGAIDRYFSTQRRPGARVPALAGNQPTSETTDSASTRGNAGPGAGRATTSQSTAFAEPPARQ